MFAKFRQHSSSLRQMIDTPAHAVLGVSNSKSTLVMVDMLSRHLKDTQALDDRRRQAVTVIDSVSLAQVDIGGNSDFTSMLDSYDLPTTRLALSDAYSGPVPAQQLDDLLQSVSPTSRQTLITHFVRQSLLRHARLSHIPVLCTAETATSLAISSIVNIAQGQGDALLQTTAVLHSYKYDNQQVTHFKPMLSFSDQEIDFYIRHYHLSYVDVQKRPGNDIANLVSTFLTNLQEQFPSTVSTIARTAEKVASRGADASRIRCRLCGMPARDDGAAWRTRTAIASLATSDTLRPDEISPPGPTLCYGCIVALADGNGRHVSPLLPYWTAS